MKTIYILLLLLLIVGFSSAQTIEVGTDSLSYYESNYQYLKAINFINKVYSKNIPPDIANRKAILLEKVGKNKEAGNIYSEIYGEDSLSIANGINLALSLTKQKQYIEAQNLYEKLYRIDSSNFYLNSNLALLYHKNKKTYKAIKIYIKNHELDSTDITTTINIAKLFLQKEHSGSSAHWASKGLALEPNNVELLYIMSKAKYMQKDYPKATLYLDNLLSLGDTAKKYIILKGKLSFEQAKYNSEKYIDVIRWFSKVADPMNETEVIHYYLGISYHELGEEKKSIKHLSRAIELGISSYVPIYLEKIAYSYISEKNYQKAINTWEKLNLLSPNIKYDYYIANITYTYLNDKKLAISRYETVMRKDKSKATKYYADSYIKIQQLKKKLHLEGKL
ncbi:MAG: hypothetical protein ABFR62_10080 [Bacteroidota bacterium]